MRWRWVAMAVVAPGALGTAGEAKPHIETISYETTPCFGTCPVYKVTVSSNGRGVFEGRRFTAVTGRREFRVTRAQWRAFRGKLQALYGHGRVDMDEAGGCRIVVSDMQSVEVAWSGGFRPFTLKMNYGCDRDRHGWMFAHLRQAPATLPIARFVRPTLPPGSPDAGRSRNLGQDHTFSSRPIALQEDRRVMSRSSDDVVSAVAAALSAHDIDAFAALFASDYVNHQQSAAAPVNGRLTAKQATVALFEGRIAGLPNLTVTVQQHLQQGDLHAASFVYEGTQTAAFEGHPPSGRRLRFTSCDIYRVVGGKIVEHWGMGDIAGVEAQLKPE